MLRGVYQNRPVVSPRVRNVPSLMLLVFLYPEFAQNLLDFFCTNSRSAITPDSRSSELKSRSERLYEKCVTILS